MLTSKDRTRGWCGVWPLVVVLLVFAAPAVAQDAIQVNTAEPNTAEQGTFGLEVMVGGENFPSDAEVDFYVTGTCDYEADPECEGDPGGITVGKVKRQGPKSLKVTIDVAEDAQYEFRFDVLVRSSRGGRSGKGTELFGVTKKEHPTQDTTPPGVPLDLHVVEAGFSAVTVAWTMPADDGYEENSGPVQYCKAEGYCLGYPGVNLNPWPALGEEQVCIMTLLEPDTEYLYGVSCTDESGNWSDEAQVLATTRPFGELQDPAWSIEEVPIPVDGLVGHGLDADGNVVIGGVVALWDQIGKGKWATVPTVIRVITGQRDETSGAWSWSHEDVAGFASRLLIDPAGRPAFEGGVLVDPKNRIRDLVYTFFDGSSWRSETVARGGEHGLRFPQGFAFDPNGNPAIAWCSRDSVGGVRLARRSPTQGWSVEQVSDETCYDGARSAGLTFDSEGNPVVTYRVDTGPDSVAIRMALLSGGSWIPETIYECTGCPGSGVAIHAPSVVYDSWAGDFSVVGDDWVAWTVGCDRAGPESWQCTEPLFGQLGQQGMFGDLLAQGVWVGESVLEADAAGELFASYGAENGYGIGLARRFRGSTAWSTEFVDHPSTHGLSLGNANGGGPFLALDPLGSPTLTWQWNLGGEPAAEYHLYFAWKETP